MRIATIDRNIHLHALIILCCHPQRATRYLPSRLPSHVPSDDLSAEPDSPHCTSSHCTSIHHTITMGPGAKTKKPSGRIRLLWLSNFHFDRDPARPLFGPGSIAQACRSYTHADHTTSKREVVRSSE